jgi:hypothetical protein
LAASTSKRLFVTGVGSSVIPSMMRCTLGRTVDRSGHRLVRAGVAFRCAGEVVRVGSLRVVEPQGLRERIRNGLRSGAYAGKWKPSASRRSRR